MFRMLCDAQVPFGGCYRLVDIPMSNCINSGINKIYVLTQFNSQSLNRHIARTYNWGGCINFGGGFVEVLSLIYYFYYILPTFQVMSQARHLLTWYTQTKEFDFYAPFTLSTNHKLCYVKINKFIT